jgi:HupE/UreJ protein
MGRAGLRALALLAAVLAAVLATPVTAHPLGNATVNRQTALALGPAGVTLDFRVDMAELPALAAEAEADSDGDGTVGEGEWRAQARRWAGEAGAALQLTVDGRPLPLRLVAVEHGLAVGEAGLPLLRLHARFRAALPATPPRADPAAGEGDGDGARAARIAFTDGFRPLDRGWREIWASTTGGAALQGAVARQDRSQGLQAYPAGAVPPDERRVEFLLLRPAPAPIAAKAPAAVPAADTAAGTAPPDGEAAAPAALPVDAPERAAQPTPPTPRAPAPSAGALFRLGIHHILTGFDHLAFLAGLLLLVPGWRGAAKVVTAFTLAHSLTLFLAASGRVVVPPAWVEPAIALTVAWVGGLALIRRGRGHGLGLAFAFGLIHGLGFAGALAESLGAAGDVPLLPLLTFNLGIEACQLALVVVTLAAVALARRWAAPRREWRVGFQPTRSAGAERCSTKPPLHPLRGAAKPQAERGGGAFAPAHALASLAVTASGLAWFVARLGA